MIRELGMPATSVTGQTWPQTRRATSREKKASAAPSASAPSEGAKATPKQTASATPAVGGGGQPLKARGRENQPQAPNSIFPPFLAIS